MGREVNRVDAVRAGIEFPGYIEMLRLCADASNVAEACSTELKLIRQSLNHVFQNPAFPLEAVEAEYLAGNGSNEVLRKAFHGLPSYVLDWFRVGQVSMVALHERLSGMNDQSDFDLQAVENHLARAGVPQADRAKALITFAQIVSLGFLGKNLASEFHRFDNQLQSLAAQQDKPIMKPNIWINGSFFLVALLAIIVAIRVLTGQLSPIWIAVVLVGGIVAVIAIGVLALRSNDQITDKTFLEALRMVFRSLPLVGRLVGPSKDAF
jgi:hypothetical protein